MRLAFLFCVSFLLGSPAHAQESVATNVPPDFTRALASVREQPRPVLVQFTATWCQPCQLMELNTLKDDTVAKSLGQLARVKVDIDQFPEFAAKHGVRGIPAFVMLSADGDEGARTSGYQDAKSFNTWLLQGMGATALVKVRREQFEQQRRALLQQVRSPDAAERRKAVAALLDIAASAEKSEQEFAKWQLREVAAAAPAAVIEGLLHPRLATRILVSNLLRDRLGEAFEFDPWASPRAREEAVGRARAMIATKFPR